LDGFIATHVGAPDVTKDALIHLRRIDTEPFVPADSEAVTALFARRGWPATVGWVQTHRSLRAASVGWQPPYARSQSRLAPRGMDAKPHEPGRAGRDAGRRVP
jgi:hypothetical protein